MYCFAAGSSEQYVNRVQVNGPGGYAEMRVRILSGDQYPTMTHVRIRPRKGELMIYGVHFRDDVGNNPIGTMHTDCVYSVGQTQVSTERIKDNITPLDSDLLLEFCNALSPSILSTPAEGRVASAGQPAEAA